MLHELRYSKILALVLLAVLTAAAQTEPVGLKSPNGGSAIRLVPAR